MGDIVIEPGETKKLVSQPGPDAAYNITVENADVYMSHDKSRVLGSGKRVRPGDRVTVDNLRGKSLYAKNPPENDENAVLGVNQAGFNLIFQPRPVVGAVRTSAGNEASPANDEDAHEFSLGYDVAANGDAVATLEMPDAAESLVTSVDDASGAFEVVVEFLDAPGGNVLTTRDSDNSGEYEGDSTTDVFVETLPASPHVRVRIRDDSGGANNTLDYSIYAR